jgi:kinesin family protein 16B
MQAIMSGDPGMLEKMQEQLAQKEAKEQQLTAEWNEKWREAAKILQEHNALGLKRTGLGVVLDSDKPHLIGKTDKILQEHDEFELDSAWCWTATSHIS